ncbi:MAG: helix-turn-helix transcriptional regulator [bacterium]|nr:helix-turn-helix transcriptional regulator [bacterium]
MKKAKTAEIAAIGKRIKDVRTHLRIQQKEMAQKLGITSAHLSEIEKGKSSPSTELVLKITKTYNMSLEFLFLGKGEMLYDQEPVNAGDQFTFDSSMTSLEKLVWMLKKSDYFAILVMGAAARIMLEENDLILETVSDNKKA